MNTIFQRLGLNMIEGGMVSISSVKVTPGGVVLTWFGPVAATYHVQWTDSLAPAVWGTVPAPVTSTNGIFTFTDD